MFFNRFYLNSETDESTRSHHVAMKWLKSGVDVEVWVNGRRSKIWQCD